MPQLVLVVGPFSGETDQTGWSEFGMATMRMQKIHSNVKVFQSEKMSYKHVWCVLML